MTTAKIYHNEGEGRFWKYDPDTADLKLVHEVGVDLADYDGGTPTGVLEDLFRRYNVGDDPEFGTPDPDALAYRAAGNRSLSVGDVIVIGETAFACESLGWKPVEFPRERVQ